MLAAKVPTAKTISDAQKTATTFGVKEEREWLERYFRLPGGPVGKPYFNPGTGEWVQDRYPDRSLQRRRKDFDGTVFHHPDEARWAFRSNAASVLKQKVVEEKTPVPAVALMAWMWRDRNIDSVEGATKDFIAQMGLNRDGLLGTVYSTSIPAEFKDAGLAETPLSRNDIAELIGASLAAPATPVLGAIVQELEKALAHRKYIFAPGLVQRIVGGWLVGDVVVLVGPPGSGKTFLARALAEGLKSVFGTRFLSAFLQVSPDYDIAQFLGYENLAGEFTAGRFARDVLFTGEVSDPRLVVLDEWNLAQIDAYFAPVLSVIEAQSTLRLPGRVQMHALTEDQQEELKRAQPAIAEGQWTLPENTFFMATCNSWIDEPESRLPVSGPVKRRCRIIAMPNVLDLKFQEKGSDGIVEACDTILGQELMDIRERGAAGHASVWDKHREERLTAIPSFAALPESVRAKLIQILRVLLENPHTRSTITLGILRDVILSCVFAPAGSEFDALGEQIADKVLHQVLGDPKVLESITALSKDFKNGEEISELARRMGAYGEERRIRPLI
jgi:hypothetical protein